MKQKSKECDEMAAKSIPDVIDLFDFPGLILASKFYSESPEYLTLPPQKFYPLLWSIATVINKSILFVR